VVGACSIRVCVCVLCYNCACADAEGWPAGSWKNLCIVLVTCVRACVCVYCPTNVHV